jgi:hypothetical protein
MQTLSIIQIAKREFASEYAGAVNRYAEIRPGTRIARSAAVVLPFWIAR